jgi:pimeloyl-ACP methyl ester carboxylesterase
VKHAAATAIVITAGLVLGACDDGNDASPATTTTISSAPLSVSSAAESAPSTNSTARAAGVSPLHDAPLPPPVDVIQSPPAGGLADPTFAALPGATAIFGQLGGATYQIEMPDTWNGRLVMWMHGFENFAPQAQVSPPDFRRLLISHGYAWAASSFSTTGLIPGVAADETAALWDHFVATQGRPTWTYVTGASMGGWATHIAAERYANRYDGALSLCGGAGTAALPISSDQLVAAAYVAGITQADVDAASDVAQLFDARVRPALDDPAVNARFEALVVAMTGGPRAFAEEGVRLEEATNWQRGMLLVATQLVPPRVRPYVLAPGSGFDEEEFNAAAVRLPSNPEAVRSFEEGMELSGDLAMPLVTMHTTGDGQVPINQAQILRELVDQRGRGDLLVQRVVQDAGHCGFTTPEQAAGFQALVDWVERGKRPEGTDLTNPDLTHLDRTFELRSRSARGDLATLTFTGAARLDGQAFNADFVGAHVYTNGLISACQVSGRLDNGVIELEVATAATATGCGAPGTQMLPWIYIGAQRFFATAPIAWPSGRAGADVSIDFSTSEPMGASASFREFFGEVYTTAGEHVDQGTIEARIDGVVCGVTSIRTFGSFNGYVLVLVGPDSNPACADGRPITFTVDDVPAKESIPNVERGSKQTDLTI